VIENGTRSDERLFSGAVGELAALVARDQLSGPAIILIGETAAAARQSALESALQAAERLRA
jgi:uroporphyrin-III C-methyltransferase/precorrin-2 dehydrogenase/sirohydrochlorin ferrochelatase